MEQNGRRDFLFVLYILCVIALAFLYMSVPERKELWDFQFRWWGEFKDLLLSIPGLQR